MPTEGLIIEEVSAAGHRLAGGDADDRDVLDKPV